MADELVPAPNAGDAGETTPPAEKPAVEKRARPHLEIQRSVATRLANSGPALREAVEKALEDVQQERRKTAILKAIEMITAEDKELSKLLAQGVQSFSASNEPVGVPVFSKQQMQDIKNKREAIQKLDNALTSALEKLDFQKLFEVTGENK